MEKEKNNPLKECAEGKIRDQQPTPLGNSAELD
jgi:hypothetical protein